METKKKADDTVIIADIIKQWEKSIPKDAKNYHVMMSALIVMAHAIADEDLDEKTEEDVYDVLLCELRGFVKSEKRLKALNKKNYEQED